MDVVTGMNLVDLLLKTDNEKLDFHMTGEMEIPRLSKATGTRFAVKVRGLSGNRYMELGSSSLDSKGNVDYMKAFDMSAIMAAEGLVDPNPKDPALMAKFEAKTPKDLMLKLFNGGEIAKIADKITDLSGFGADSDEQIKN